MRFRVTVLFIVAVFQNLTCSAATANEAASARTMVLTFDDLPYAARAAHRNTVPHVRLVTDAILATLEKHQAPATAKEQGDEATAMRICAAYWDFVVRATEFAENISAQIFGRNIPQTLVLHANDINADCLDELLVRFERRGYEFVSLDAVISDAAYETQDTFVTAYGPSWLWRWMKSKDMNISFRGDPEPPGWVTALFEQASLPRKCMQRTSRPLHVPTTTTIATALNTRPKFVASRTLNKLEWSNSVVR